MAPGANTDTVNLLKVEYVSDDHSWTNPANRIGPASAGSFVVSRFYLGGSDGRITNDPGLVANGSFTMSLRHAVPNPDGTFNWVSEAARLDQGLHVSTRSSRQTTDSLTLGLQSSTMQDRVVTTIGYRRDKNDASTSAQMPVNPATGLLDDGLLYPQNPSQVVFGNTYTFGAVGKVTKWLSFTYNKSENFTPAGQQLDLYGNSLALPTGLGEDWGTRFSFAESKFVLSINAFHATADKARGTPATGFVQRTARLDQIFRAWAGVVAVQRLGLGASAAAVDAEVQKITQLPAGLPPPETSLSSTSTIDARGLEVQLHYRPVSAWNIKLTVGQQKSIYANIAPEYDEYISQRMPIWLSAKDGSGVAFWTLKEIPTTLKSAGDSPSTFYANVIVAPIKLAKALEHKRTRNQREWSGSLIKTYRFTQGPMKGLAAGGAVRWQSEAIIGYYGAAPDADGIVRQLDADRPIHDNVKPSVDLWISRDFKMPAWFGKTFAAKVQLNVRNATEAGHLQPIGVNPDGTPVTFRIVDPREWFLATTLSF